MLKRIFTILLFICVGILPATAQNFPLSADKIVGLVGNRFIIMSDVNAYYLNQKQEFDTLTEDAKCSIFFDMMAQKVLAEQAFRDSITVADGQIELELNDRIDKFIVHYGGREAMESRLGKSIFQIKQENRELVKEQLEAQTLKGKLANEVVITPEEVRAFFDKMSKDKLPYVNATVEIGHIIYNPIASPEVEDYTKTQLQGIRDEIVNKQKDFATAAGIYSQDPGTRDNGGMMTSKKNALDPVFAANAFRLKEGEISPVFRSSFGYHIVEMVKRMGEEATLRHILLIPDVTSSDMEAAVKKMDSLKSELDAGKISFSQAVDKVSNDEVAKNRGGIMFDLENGETKMSLDRLDPQAAKNLPTMQVGDYSNVEIFQNPYKNGARAVRILYLKDRIDPHVANFEDDFTFFNNMAKTEKQQAYITDKVYEYAKTMYIKIDPQYHHCDLIKPFLQETANN